MMEVNKIYCMDAIEFLKKIENNSVDLIIVDPPYNISIDTWDKFESKEYLKWCNEWIDEILRVTRVNGSIYIFGDFRFVGDIKVLMNEKKVFLNSWIVWDKGTKAQNSTRSFINVTEHILFYIKGVIKDLNIPTEINSVRDYLREEKNKSEYTNKQFNFMFSELYNKVGCRDRSVIEHYFSEMQWVFPSKEIYEKILQKTGYFKRDYFNLKKEYKSLIYTFNIDDIRTKRNPKDKRVFRNDRQLVPNVWYFNVKDEMAKINHPTPKPLEMIKNIVKVSSDEGDLVLDCFIGSGTTAIACKQLGRNFIGCDNNKEYVEIANKRLIQNTLTKLNSENISPPKPKGMGIRNGRII